MTTTTPLAERMRPQTLSDIVGQDKWLAPGAPLRDAIDHGEVASLLLWGPPGCGKTTLAHCIAQTSHLRFKKLSAVLDGIKQLRIVVEEATTSLASAAGPMLLFIDEIHRWNKAQQDALLPHVESGQIILIGATTENPSFEVNPALRSRMQVVRLEPLNVTHTLTLLERALATYPPTGIDVQPEALQCIANAAGGDGRRALSDLERCLKTNTSPSTLTAEDVLERLQRDDIRHDKNGEDHYNVMSALIKSMRGSDPDAALYWLARLIAGGEPPTSIGRRLIVFASEDVGNADPRALSIAVSTAQAVQMIGMPEARIPLAQAVTWLSTCPKSNASYTAINEALSTVKRHGALPVPLHLRNASTAMMQEEGYGVGYRYPHDYPHNIVQQEYWPEGLSRRRFYKPAPHGVEKTIADRLQWWTQKLSEKE